MIQGYRDTGIQGYRDTGIQGYRDTGIQGFENLSLLEIKLYCKIKQICLMANL